MQETYTGMFGSDIKSSRLKAGQTIAVHLDSLRPIKNKL